MVMLDGVTKEALGVPPTTALAGGVKVNDIRDNRSNSIPSEVPIAANLIRMIVERSTYRMCFCCEGWSGYSLSTKSLLGVRC
jgi:hypothetical protein